jgi:hypothetical protein
LFVLFGFCFFVWILFVSSGVCVDFVYFFDFIWVLSDFIRVLVGSYSLVCVLFQFGMMLMIFRSRPIFQSL